MTRRLKIIAAHFGAKTTKLRATQNIAALCGAKMPKFRDKSSLLWCRSLRVWVSLSSTRTQRIRQTLQPAGRIKNPKSRDTVMALSALPAVAFRRGQAGPKLKGCCKDFAIVFEDGCKDVDVRLQSHFGIRFDEHDSNIAKTDMAMLIPPALSSLTFASPFLLILPCVLL